MKVKIHIILKAGVLDPQGHATRNALHALGFTTVQQVRQGKVIELEIEETESKTARATVTKMCDQLLANTVIEEYLIEIV